MMAFFAPVQMLNAQQAIPQSVSEMNALSKPKSERIYEPTKSLQVPAVKHKIKVETKTIRVSPSESKTVSLSRDASTVIVANPMHATVFLDTPRQLVIMPRAPGATQVKVLDDKGHVIFDKGVLVDGASDNHLRIRRICHGGDECEPQTIYYCPEGNCAAISVQEARAMPTYSAAPTIERQQISKNPDEKLADPDETLGGDS